jgi:hypothetical protein
MACLYEFLSPVRLCLAGNLAKQASGYDKTHDVCDSECSSYISLGRDTAFLLKYADKSQFLQSDYSSKSEFRMQRSPYRQLRHKKVNIIIYEGVSVEYRTTSFKTA